MPVIYVTGADDDWCAVIDQALGGDIVLLEPGRYAGPCTIDAKASDLPGEQTIVQSLDPSDRAVLVTSQVGAILSVSGDRLVLDQLDFDAADIGVSAGNLAQLWLLSCTWTGPGGAALLQTGDIDELRVTDAVVHGWSDPLAVGCPDGSCVASDFELSAGLIVDAQTAIAVHPGSQGSVRDWVVADCAAEALVVAGGAEVEIVGNLLSSQSRALWVQDGPVEARANLFFGDLDASGAQIAAVDLVGNTVLGTLDLSGWSDSRGLTFAGNAVHGEVPMPAGGQVHDNVGCPELDACFVEAEAWDLYPTPTSPLRQAGGLAGDLGPDWCGRVRSTPATAGAFEAAGDGSYGPRSAAAKADQSCTLLDVTPPAEIPTEPTGPTAPDPGTTLQAPEPSESATGCGCATAQPVLWRVAAAGLARRRAADPQMRHRVGMTP